LSNEVVVVGGGLSGLVACYELEKLGVPYTLIEVKRELGGTLHTIQKDGFTIDSMAFAFMDNLAPAWLQELGLLRALYALKNGVFAFEKGAQTLVNALTSKITAPAMMRMAVSSIGEIEGKRLAICLENGMMLEAKRVILAVPARYASRLFASYIPPITAELLDYHYDTIHRVSFGYFWRDLHSHEPKFYRDPAYVFNHRTEFDSRVPDNHVLLQIGVRIAPEHTTPDQLVQYLIKQLELSPKPIFSHVAYWAEADPLSCYDDHHAQRMANIAQHLPAHIALIGSDYSQKPSLRTGVVRLDDRIAQAQRAVQKVMQA
jgi:protoporphyrinogen oxidase